MGRCTPLELPNERILNISWIQPEFQFFLKWVVFLVLVGLDAQFPGAFNIVRTVIDKTSGGSFNAVLLERMEVNFFAGF